MTATKKSITLPPEMAKFVADMVASGEYGSESEVIRDGLRALQKQNALVESWLETQVAAAYDALKADPARAVTGDSIRDRLYQRLERRTKNAA
nr:type II toxin-antitoxin system ParD family antitoxin [Dyella sp. ASV24]